MTIGMSEEFASFDQRAVIKVCGVGGGGGNAVSRMIEGGLSGVEFITINTDAQALKTSPAQIRLQIGINLTSGLGSGAKPEVGHQAAEEDRERIKEVIQGADMVFLTAGLGGGTGTGAMPVVAEEASASGALVVAIVTLPFEFENPERMRNAQEGLMELEKYVDTLIVIPNDRVAELARADTSFLSAFSMADEVLHNGVRAISELITVTGLINLDFADVHTVMQSKGRALMGIGVAEGEDRAILAAKEAIVCPLLELSNIHGAKGVIVNIKGGCDIGMREIQQAVSIVKESAHPDANIIFGAVIDEDERPELQVTVIAAGFTKENASATPTPLAPVPSPHPKVKPASGSTPPSTVPSPEKAADKPVPTGKKKPQQELDLFPGPPVPEPVPVEKDDMGLPTFLRNRKKRK